MMVVLWLGISHCVFTFLRDIFVRYSANAYSGDWTETSIWRYWCGYDISDKLREGLGDRYRTSFVELFDESQMSMTVEDLSEGGSFNATGRLPFSLVSFFLSSWYIVWWYVLREEVLRLYKCMDKTILYGCRKMRGCIGTMSKGNSHVYISWWCE